MLGEKLAAVAPVMGERLGADEVRAFRRPRLATCEAPEFVAIGVASPPRNAVRKMREWSLRRPVAELVA